MNIGFRNGFIQIYSRLLCLCGLQNRPVLTRGHTSGSLGTQSTLPLSLKSRPSERIYLRQSSLIKEQQQHRPVVLLISRDQQSLKHTNLKSFTNDLNANVQHRNRYTITKRSATVDIETHINCDGNFWNEHASEEIKNQSKSNHLNIAKSMYNDSATNDEEETEEESFHQLEKEHRFEITLSDSSAQTARSVLNPHSISSNSLSDAGEQSFPMIRSSNPISGNCSKFPDVKS